jgi:type IV pilus assembly protein PilO
MTNLQDAANPNASRLQQRLLLGVPIGVGALVSALIIGFGVVPQWLRLQADSERLAQLEELKARIPMLRAQIAKTAEDQSIAERRQRRVLQMIEGSGELSTFLAQLDREATRLGVQLDLYEPVAAPAPPPADAKADPKQDPKKGDGPAPAPQSPLEAAGLQAQRVLLTAKAPYPNLLAFLRATEKLSVLVSQSSLSLAGVEQAKDAPQNTAQPGSAKPVVAPPVAKTELKLMLTSYRSADAQVATPTPKKP